MSDSPSLFLLFPELKGALRKHPSVGAAHTNPLAGGLVSDVKEHSDPRRAPRLVSGEETRRLCRARLVASSAVLTPTDQRESAAGTRLSLRFSPSSATWESSGDELPASARLRRRTSFPRAPVVASYTRGS